MGYDKLAGLRDLFERDTGLLNQTQRFILDLMTQIEGVQGFFLESERFYSMVGLNKRAVLTNLHYLGDGKSFKDGSWKPCAKLECKGHLLIVSRDNRAKPGTKQVYRTHLAVYETLISVHASAPIITFGETNSVRLEPESVHLEVIKGAPTSQLGSTPVHPYIQDIQDIQDIQEQESYAVKLQNFLDTKLSNEKRFTVTHDLVRVCGELSAKGTTFMALETALSAVGKDSIHNPPAFVRARLNDLVTHEPDWSSDNKPPWCGTCDERTRKNNYKSPVPDGNGAETYSCPACDPFMVNKKNNS